MCKLVCKSLFTLSFLILGCGYASSMPRHNAESLRFLVMGDWGGLPDFPYRTPIEKATAAQMGRIADKLDSQFLLALGDNFYFDGVKDVDDKRFYETYESVFTAKSLMRPWYLVAGNHDWNGNASAQVEYSKRSKRWNYPYFYYPLTFDVPGTKMTVDILMIDTVILCGNSDADYLKKQPDFPEDFAAAEDHWAWIEKSLRTSKADYLLVAGHYPVYSVAEHGPTKCLVSRLEPMLHKYHANAYFCGHEHNLQHLEYTDKQYNSTVQYFISGSANFVDPKFDHMDAVPHGSLRFHWADILTFGAFSYVETTANNMTYQFIRSDGKILYQQVMLPRKV